jgi:hypothetical protein
MGFWMFIEGTRPARPVRVFVTYEALAQLSPLPALELPGALEAFKNERPTIEVVSSRKFDAEGVGKGDYGGCPILTINSQDLAGNV